MKSYMDELRCRYVPAMAFGAVLGLAAYLWHSEFMDNAPVHDAYSSTNHSSGLAADGGTNGIAAAEDAFIKNSINGSPPTYEREE